jgi:nicotinate-nucleotide adenylyltransferase
MLGIYGGTFNPVHYGHLRTALEAKAALGLDSVAMLPCAVPPHRQMPTVSAALRLQMLQLACQDTPGLTVDSRELQRQGPSYTVDSLAAIRHEQPDTPLLLLMGADAFAGIERWHCWQRLADFAHIVVLTRPEVVLPPLSAYWQVRQCLDSAFLRQQPNGRLFFQAVTPLAISATAIRQVLANGDTPQAVLPDSVLAFIRAHQLYQAAPLPTGP